MSDLRSSGRRAIVAMQDIGLFVIAIATVIAMGFEVFSMIGLMRVTLADLLLMFIYLEVLAMVTIYLDSGKLPVRMPLYIGIVALARYMILDMKNMDTMRLIGIAGAVCILALTILAIRYGHVRFPYDKKNNEG